MVYITDVKKTTLTDQVADDYQKLCNEGRFTKKGMPKGCIPDINWTTVCDDPNQANKTRRGSNKTTVTSAAPTEVEG